MKKENRMDDRAKAPDPDDLSSEWPRDALRASGATRAQGQVRRDPGDSPGPNPDVSAPHIPPLD
jgi:hypothetical protein